MQEGKDKAIQHDAHARSRQGYARRSALVRYLVAGYTFLIGYASLYPFGQWQSAQGGLLAFLFQSWPRYYSVSDLVLNVVGYVPLGFLLALAILPFVPVTLAASVATVAGSVLSLAMEVLQQFISVRVASNLDVLTNGLGALLGSLIAVTLGERWLLSGLLYRWRQLVFEPGAFVDVGFVVLGLWLFTQLNPDVWLFGNGELRGLLPASVAMAYRPEAYRWLETGVTAFNLAGISLLVRALAKEDRPVTGTVFSLVSAALALKAAAAIAFYRPDTPVLWVTPGCLLGIPLGLAIYLASVWVGRPLVVLASACCVAAGVCLVNIAPENPYLAASVRTWRHGHFLSFSGLTHLVSSVWPLLALAYLGRLAQLRRRKR